MDKGSDISVGMTFGLVYIIQTKIQSTVMEPTTLDVSPLNEFVKTHYHVLYGHELAFKINAWNDCKCEENGKWISTWKLTE
jgi:hypothetical protein